MEPGLEPFYVLYLHSTAKRNCFGLFNDAISTALVTTRCMVDERARMRKAAVADFRVLP
jgi:hypothetical protein